MQFTMKEEWLKIVREQEKLLVYDKFEQEDVLKLANGIIELARGKYGQGVSIRIILDNITTFYCLMEGSTLKNDWWMTKKLNVCMRTGTSSLQSALEFEHGGKECPEWAKEEGNYALVGGCIPIRLKDGEIKGYAMVSALEHQLDHQLICDAMAGMVGIKIPSV
jgi:uncharacterized protein (UPF0303 family)